MSDIKAGSESQNLNILADIGVLVYFLQKFVNLAKNVTNAVRATVSRQ